MDLCEIRLELLLHRFRSILVAMAPSRRLGGELMRRVTRLLGSIGQKARAMAGNPQSVGPEELQRRRIELAVVAALEGNTTINDGELGKGARRTVPPSL